MRGEGSTTRAVPARPAARLVPDASAGEDELCRFRLLVRVGADEETLCSALQAALAAALGAPRVLIYERSECGRLFLLRAGTPPAGGRREIGARHPLVQWARDSTADVLRMPPPLSPGQLPLGEPGDLCLPLRQARDDLVGLVWIVRCGTAPAEAERLERAQDLAALYVSARASRRDREELATTRELVARMGGLCSLGTLAAGVAHEIRNPLVSIQTFFQLAPERLDDEEFRSRFLPMAAEEVSRIYDLTSELLDMARPSQRGRDAMDLVAVVEHVLAFVEPRARKGRVAIRLEKEQPSLVIHADEGQVKQVLLNLLMNAIEVTARRGVVDVRVCRRTGSGVDLAVVEVADQGPGIAPELREQIFSPFFTTRNGGTGLGLSIALQIARDHGGRIDVESTPGAGARFRACFPMSS